MAKKHEWPPAAPGHSWAGSLGQDWWVDLGQERRGGGGEDLYSGPSLGRTGIIRNSLLDPLNIREAARIMLDPRNLPRNFENAGGGFLKSHVKELDFTYHADSIHLCCKCHEPFPHHPTCSICSIHKMCCFPACVL